MILYVHCHCILFSSCIAVCNSERHVVVTVSVLYDVIRDGVCHNELYFCMADLQKKLQNIHICSADIFILLLYIICLNKNVEMYVYSLKKEKKKIDGKWIQSTGKM